MFTKEDIKSILLFTALLGSIFYQIWVLTGPQ